MPNKHQKTIWMSESTLSRLEAISKTKGIPLSTLANSMMADGLDIWEQQFMSSSIVKRSGGQMRNVDKR